MENTSEDSKIYTFHLRKNVKFHDDEPFKAEAVKMNIEAVQRNASKHAWINCLIKVNILDYKNKNIIVHL